LGDDEGAFRCMNQITIALTKPKKTPMESALAQVGLEAARTGEDPLHGAGVAGVAGGTGPLGVITPGLDSPEPRR
jgi:hypothetical protein